MPEPQQLNLEALKLLESVKSGDFERSHKTCSEIDTKARLISLSYAAFLAAIIAYIFESFTNDQLIKQLFLIGLMPPLFLSSWLFSRSLVSKEYVEGMRVDSYESMSELETYYTARINFLNDSVRQNCEANSKKSKALGDGTSMLLGSFLIAFVVSVIITFINNFLPTTACICFWLSAFIVSIVLTFLANHFLILSRKESSLEDSIAN